MSWPAKLRAVSFGMTLGVVFLEFAIPAVPIGLVLWITGVADAARVATILGVLGAVIALVIVVPAHLRSRTAIVREALEVFR